MAGLLVIAAQPLEKRGLRQGPRLPYLVDQLPEQGFLTAPFPQGVVQLGVVRGDGHAPRLPQASGTGLEIGVRLEGQTQAGVRELAAEGVHPAAVRLVEAMVDGHGQGPPLAWKVS